jgi:carbon starvation protein
VALVKMKRERYLWVTALPTAWLVLCTLTAGWQKVFSSDARVSFLAHARAFSEAAEAGKVLAPARSLADMRQVVTNDSVDAILTGFFMLLVVATVGFGLRAARAAWRSSVPTAQETAAVPLPAVEG